MVCPRLAEKLDTLMFKSFFMNVSSLAVISLCTSIIFYLIPPIFFQIKSYSHFHYHLNARCSKPFWHFCAECHATAAFGACGFCSRSHEYVLGGLASVDTGGHSGRSTWMQGRSTWQQGKEHMTVHGVYMCIPCTWSTWCGGHNGCPSSPAEQM